MFPFIENLFYYGGLAILVAVFLYLGARLISAAIYKSKKDFEDP